MQFGIGKNGHRRRAGEFAKVPDHVGLIEVAGLGGNRCPVTTALCAQSEGVTEAQNPSEVPRCQTALFEAPPAEMARTQTSLFRDAFEVHLSVRPDHRCYGLLYRARRSRGHVEPFSQQEDGIVGIEKALFKLPGTASQYTLQ